MNGSPHVHMHEVPYLLHSPYFLILYSTGDSIGDIVLQAV